jgi:hypothetical protein
MEVLILSKYYLKIGYMLSRYKPVLKKDNKLTVEHLPSFKRAGYYDWRLVVASQEGKLRPLQVF